MLKRKSIITYTKGPSDATILEKTRWPYCGDCRHIYRDTFNCRQNVGLQSILSLLFNTAFIIVSIGIHNTFSGTNLFLLMSIAIILSTILTLVLVTGWQNELGLR